ncbi:hypothetical protein ACIA5D_18970 [Actinoplanes sp. NPDC051513]
MRFREYADRPRQTATYRPPQPRASLAGLAPAPPTTPVAWQGLEWQLIR